MTQQLHLSNSNFNKPISSEHLNQIIEAILDGKYSWACVLLLRCAGYNPLLYIPYRTYNRLLKENSSIDQSNPIKTVAINKNKQDATSRFNGKSAQKSLSKISDLTYLEVVNEPSKNLRGGAGANVIAFPKRI